MFQQKKYILANILIIRGLSVAHARLESVYTPKAYPEFESRSLRKKENLVIS